MRKLALLLLALLVVPLATATLGGKDYPRPDLAFTVYGGTSTFPGTMTVIADLIPNGDVQSIQSIAQDTYAKGVEFLFQTCYRQGVLEVTYKDTTKGMKTFLVLYCPSNDKIRLSPTTGPSYQALHRDVQYDYEYTSKTTPTTGSQPPTAPGTTASSTTDPDALLLGMFKYYLNAANTSVQTIEMKSNEALLLPPQTDPISGAITSFQAGFVSGNEGSMTRYDITKAGSDGISIENTETHTITIVMPEQGLPAATIAPAYTLAPLPNTGAETYQLNPRTTALLSTEDTLEFVDQSGKTASPDEANKDGANICDKKFDPDNLYLKVDCGAFDDPACGSSTPMKVASVSPATGADGSPTQYYTVGYLNPDNAQQYINVYCNAPTSTQQGGASATSTGTLPATIDAPPQCNSVSTVTLQTNSANCQTGKDCAITFNVAKKDPKKPLPDYCLIGFIQSGNLLKDAKGNAMRWIYPCSQLSNKRITVTLPANAVNPKVYLFPIQNNGVTMYLTAHPTIKEAFEAGIKSNNGYQTPDMLLDLSSRPQYQCTTGNGGDSKVVMTTSTTSSSVKPSPTVQTGLLGTSPVTVDFSRFTDNVFQINKTDGTPSGFVLVNLTGYPNYYGGVSSDPAVDLSKETWWLFNNFPVIEQKSWYSVDGSTPLDSATRQKIVNEYNSYYDAYCLRRDTTTDKTPYATSLGTCGAYVFFPKGKTGTIMVYTTPSVNANKETVLSLVVTGASRIMTQHLNYHEKPDMLSYGFWTTTIPQEGKPVTISLGYPNDATTYSHPVYDCAAGSISNLSADFRESQDAVISSKLQPTRAFISPGESGAQFAYCSAAGEMNELFPGMTQAYVDGTSFVSDTTLKTTIREYNFVIGRAAGLWTTGGPVEITGLATSGIGTKQIFQAKEVTPGGGQTGIFTIQLEKPAGNFKRNYQVTLGENNGYTNNLVTKYANNKWVLTPSVNNKFTTGLLEPSSNDGDLEVYFDFSGLSRYGPLRIRGYGLYQSYKIKSLPQTTTTAKQQTSTQTNMGGKATATGLTGDVAATGAGNTLTGFAVQSQTAANGVTTLFESDKPDLSPGRVMAKASQNRQQDLNTVLQQSLVFAEYVTDKSPDDLNLSTLFGDPVNIMAKTQASFTWKKDVDELGTAVYGNTLWDLVEIVYDGQLPNNQNHYILVMKAAGSVPSTTTATPPTQQPAIPSQAPEDKYCAINIQGDCYSLNAMGCGDCGTKPVQVKDTSGRIIQACRCQLTI